MSPQSTDSQPPPLPSLQEIRQRTFEVLGRRPCLWQCETALAILRGDKDVVCISGTGSGKTLTFWMPLLFRPNGIQVVITPLNLLGHQNQHQLEQLGIRAIAIRGETATQKNIEDIRACRYRVIAVSPEVALKPRGIFEQVWRDETFVNRVISVVWDEGHLLKAWASFREELGEASRLRNLIPLDKPYLIPSATLPEATLLDVLDIARVRRNAMVLIRRSNDRPNVYLTVRRIHHRLSTYKDLEFLVPDGWQPGMRIPKFVVFFDNIDESIRACEVIRQRLPPGYRDRIVWFNASNTASYREATTARFQLPNSEIYGLFCTDAFGMGIDIPDIEVVVQWRPTCDLNSLWQRFGRAAREPGREAIAVLFVDSKYFDDEKEAAKKRAQKRQEASQRRAAQQEDRKRKRASAREDGTADWEQNGRRAGAKRSRVEGDSAEGALTSGRSETDSQAGTSARQSDGAGSTLSEYEGLRVLFKTTKSCLNLQAAKGSRVATALRGSALESDNIGPELDNLINAAMRRFRCYRKPITAFYENDRLSPDTDVCLTEGGKVCGRCILPPSSICCSLCSPDHPVFQILPPVSTSPGRAPNVSRASQVDTKYAMTEVDKQFRAALHVFRREQTIKIYGYEYLINLGPDAVMGDAVLKRLIDCARVHKIRCLDSLYRETKWNRTWELGVDVLEVINRFYPAPVPLAPTAHDPSENAVEGTPTTSKRGSRKCSACGSMGHIRSNESCPNYTPKPRTTRGKEKENASPEGQRERVEAECDARVGTSAVTSTFNQSWQSPSYNRVVLTPSELERLLQGSV